MSRTVCIFCASSNKVDPIFLEAARETGRLLAREGIDLLYGGGCVGLMGQAALGAHDEGGRVVGVIPEKLMTREVAYMESDELVVTKDLYERKEIMIDRSDAFLTLPGGFGTLDELMEVVTLRQLNYHQKPLAFLNTKGFYNNLLQFFDDICSQHFAPEDHGYWQVLDKVDDLKPWLTSF